jgi:endonuclease/exonuclease/phosphatase family metal-dependent hydrolase
MTDVDSEGVEPVRQRRTLRVATFNIKHSATASGYLGRPWRLAGLCAAIPADILALQEVDRHVWRSWFADLLTEAQGTAYASAVFGRAMGANLVSLINPGGQYGVALLVRGEVLSQETMPLVGDYVRLPFGRRRNVAPEPRVALFNRVRLANGLTLSTANTHIGGPRRRELLQAIAGRLIDLPRPLLLLGDVNTAHDQVSTWLSEASPLRLADRPVELADGYRQSDHIAVDGFEVASVSAHWTAISDHPVVLAELQET